MLEVVRASLLSVALTPFREKIYVLVFINRNNFFFVKIVSSKLKWISTVAMDMTKYPTHHSLKQKYQGQQNYKYAIYSLIMDKTSRHRIGNFLEVNQAELA